MNTLLKALIFGLLDFVLVVLVVLFITNKYFVVLTILIAQVAYLAYLITLLELAAKEKKAVEEKRVKEEKESTERESKLKKQLEEKQKQLMMRPLIINYDQLKDYISTTLSKKFGENEIRNALLSVGWPIDTVNKAFSEIKS